MDDSRIYPRGYEPQDEPEHDPGLRNQLLNHILGSAPAGAGEADIFKVMAARRSTRKFSDRPVEASKIDRVIAAADTAPTAGNYQGFEIFYVRDPGKKRRLVGACNGQPYVDAPAVLVFCKNPARVKFDFEARVLAKFAIQDATLAAGYSQLAAQALGLSSIWIGMFEEKAVMEVVGTDLEPSSVLCIGYPEQTRFPKPRRNLKELVHVI